MPIIDDINQAFRDFTAWNAQNPLPVGDPRSGVHNPSKADIRSILLAVLQATGNAEALNSLVLQIEGKADRLNSGRIFQSRAAAVAVGQANLPALIHRIITEEGNFLVLRGPFVQGTDPLFETSPYWGEVTRFPNVLLLDNKADSAVVNPRLTPSYTSRAAAVTGAADLPTSVSQILVREGTALVVRSRAATADDPLYEMAPRWGVVQRQDVATESAARLALARASSIALINVSGTTNVMTGDFPPDVGLAAPVLGTRIFLRSVGVNTGPVTVNSYPVRDGRGQPLVGGELSSTVPLELRFSGPAEDRHWIVSSPLVHPSELAAEATARTAAVTAVAADLADAAFQANLGRFIGTGSAADTIPTHVSVDNKVVGRLSPAASVVRRLIDVLIGVGQSNEKGQVGAGRALVYGATPKPGILTLLRGSAADVWIGLVGVTGGGASVELVGASFTGLGLLVPQIAATDAHGTTPIESMARKWQDLREARTGVVPDVIAFTVAEGGQSIANLQKNPPAGFYGYANMVTALQRAFDLRPLTSDLRARFLPMCQGESDTGLATLGAMQDAIRTDFQADARAITGQDDPVRMISWQPSSFQGTSNTGARSILDYALANQGAGLFFCAGPTYPFAFSSDFLHQSSQGHALRGEMGASIADIILSTGAFLPLHIVSASVTGANQITVQLSEPAAVETNSVVTAVENLGITATGGTITNISVAGSSLVLTTAGAASSVTAIRSGHVGQASPRTAEAIPRTNIRSVASIGVFSTGTPMRKWLTHRSIPIT